MQFVLIKEQKKLIRLERTDIKSLKFHYRPNENVELVFKISKESKVEDMLLSMESSTILRENSEFANELANFLYELVGLENISSRIRRRINFYAIPYLLRENQSKGFCIMSDQRTEGPRNYKGDFAMTINKEILINGNKIDMTAKTIEVYKSDTVTIKFEKKTMEETKPEDFFKHYDFELKRSVKQKHLLERFPRPEYIVQFCTVQNLPPGIVIRSRIVYENPQYFKRNTVYYASFDGRNENWVFLTEKQNKNKTVYAPKFYDGFTPKLRETNNRTMLTHAEFQTIRNVTVIDKTAIVQGETEFGDKYVVVCSEQLAQLISFELSTQSSDAVFRDLGTSVSSIFGSTFTSNICATGLGVTSSNMQMGLEVAGNRFVMKRATRMDTQTCNMELGYGETIQIRVVEEKFRQETEFGGSVVELFVTENCKEVTLSRADLERLGTIRLYIGKYRSEELVIRMEKTTTDEYQLEWRENDMFRFLPNTSKKRKRASIFEIVGVSYDSVVNDEEPRPFFFDNMDNEKYSIFRSGSAVKLELGNRTMPLGFAPFELMTYFGRTDQVRGRLVGEVEGREVKFFVNPINTGGDTNVLGIDVRNWKEDEKTADEDEYEDDDDTLEGKRWMFDTDTYFVRRISEDELIYVPDKCNRIGSVGQDALRLPLGIEKCIAVQKGGEMESYVVGYSGLKYNLERMLYGVDPYVVETLNGSISFNARSVCLAFLGEYYLVDITGGIAYWNNKKGKDSSSELIVCDKRQNDKTSTSLTEFKIPNDEIYLPFSVYEDETSKTKYLVPGSSEQFRSNGESKFEVCIEEKDAEVRIEGHFDSEVTYIDKVTAKKKSYLGKVLSLCGFNRTLEESVISLFQKLFSRGSTMLQESLLSVGYQRMFYLGKDFVLTLENDDKKEYLSRKIGESEFEISYERELVNDFRFILRADNIDLIGSMSTLYVKKDMRYIDMDEEDIQKKIAESVIGLAFTRWYLDGLMILNVMGQNAEILIAEEIFGRASVVEHRLGAEIKEWSTITYQRTSFEKSGGRMKLMIHDLLEKNGKDGSKIFIANTIDERQLRIICLDKNVAEELRSKLQMWDFMGNKLELKSRSESESGSDDDSKFECSIVKVRRINYSLIMNKAARQYENTSGMYKYWIPKSEEIVVVNVPSKRFKLVSRTSRNSWEDEFRKFTMNARFTELDFEKDTGGKQFCKATRADGQIFVLLFRSAAQFEESEKLYKAWMDKYARSKVEVLRDQNKMRIEGVYLPIGSYDPTIRYVQKGEDQVNGRPIMRARRLEFNGRTDELEYEGVFLLDNDSAEEEDHALILDKVRLNKSSFEEGFPKDEKEFKRWSENLETKVLSILYEDFMKGDAQLSSGFLIEWDEGRNEAGRDGADAYLKMFVNNSMYFWYSTKSELLVIGTRLKGTHTDRYAEKETDDVIPTAPELLAEFNSGDGENYYVNSIVSDWLSDLDTARENLVKEYEQIGICAYYGVYEGSKETGKVGLMITKYLYSVSKRIVIQLEKSDLDWLEYTDRILFEAGLDTDYKSLDEVKIKEIEEIKEGWLLKSQQGEAEIELRYGDDEDVKVSVEKNLIRDLKSRM